MENTLSLIETFLIYVSMCSPCGINRALDRDKKQEQNVLECFKFLAPQTRK